MTDFIRRDEFSQDMRSLREDIQQIGKNCSEAVRDGFDKLAEDIKEGRETLSHVRLVQAVHDKQIEALEESPRLAGVMEAGFDGVNKRLDKVNGSIGRHETDIAVLKDRLNNVQGQPAQMSNGMKAAVVTGGGVSVLAVLHSLFEMVKTLAPSVGALFR